MFIFVEGLSHGVSESEIKTHSQAASPTLLELAPQCPRPSTTARPLESGAGELAGL